MVLPRSGRQDKACRGVPQIAPSPSARKYALCHSAPTANRRRLDTWRFAYSSTLLKSERIGHSTSQKRYQRHSDHDERTGRSLERRKGRPPNGRGRTAAEHAGFRGAAHNGAPHPGYALGRRISGSSFILDVPDGFWTRVVCSWGRATSR